MQKMNADFWYDICNVLLIVSLVLGVVSTAGIVWSGKARDKSSKELVATMQKETALANLKVEELKKQVGPRVLDRGAFISALKGDVKSPVEIIYLRDDAECLHLSHQISQALKEASWDVVSLSPTQYYVLSDVPTVMNVDGQPTGVTLVVRSISEAEGKSSLNQLTGEPWIKTPFTVLRNALGEGIGKVNSVAGGQNPPESGILRIVVAPRI